MWRLYWTCCLKDEYVNINVRLRSLYKCILCLVTTMSYYCFGYIKLGMILGHPTYREDENIIVNWDEI